MGNRSGLLVLFVAAMLLGLMMGPAKMGLSHDATGQREQSWNPRTGPPKIMEQAAAAHTAKDFAKALALYQESLRSAPEAYLRDWEDYVHTELGFCFLELGRLKEALGEFEKANSLHPFVTNYIYIAVIHSQLEDYAAAEQNWRKAAALAPLDPEHYCYYASVSLELGHLEEAQKVADSVHFGTRPSRSWKTVEDAQRAMVLVRETFDTASSKQRYEHVLLDLPTARGAYDEVFRLAGKRKYLGVLVDDVSPGGARIKSLSKGAPAELAGLQINDLIVSFGNKPIANRAALVSTIEQAEFGAAYPVRVSRNGAFVDAAVIVGIPPNLRELAAQANTLVQRPKQNVTTEAKPVEPESAVRLPDLEINRLEIDPSKVAPGGQLTLKVAYTGRAKGLIFMYYEIYAGNSLIFKSEIESIEAGSDRPKLYSLPLTAGDKPGNYSIRVLMHLNEIKVERRVGFTIALGK
jgi:tetratricopeptide (TPR) repeat protein